MIVFKDDQFQQHIKKVRAICSEVLYQRTA